MTTPVAAKPARKTRRINPRLNPAEWAMLAELVRVRTGSEVRNEQTESDVVRGLIRDGYNHLMRSRGNKEIPPFPYDGGGEARRGRIAKDAKPYYAGHLEMVLNPTPAKSKD